MRVVSIDEMHIIEEQTKSEFRFDEKLIIENIGAKSSQLIIDTLSENLDGKELIFLIGKGSNGADGLAIARHMTNNGHRCRAFLFFDSELLSEALNEQLVMAQAFGVKINFLDNSVQFESYLSQVHEPVFIDALFGTGAVLPLSNEIYHIIELVNSTSAFTISIDIPSGVEGNTGHMQGNAIQADLTLAISFAKQGHYISDGAQHTGDLALIDAGFPQKFYSEGNKFLLTHDTLQDLITNRSKFADKKAFGHALVIGGSHGLTGAPILAAQAVSKVGSGLVTVATWEPQYQEMLSRLTPEIMTGYIPLDVERWARLIKDLNKYSCIVLGPGLARSSRARRLVLEVLNNYDGPLVLDADAINVLDIDQDAKAFTMRNAPTVLTPHFGEFSKFTKIDSDLIGQKPLEYLSRLVDKINCTVVLKGPCTYLANSDGTILFNYFPNDGMATGGVGDVLAGILGGLLGQETSLKSKTSLSSRYEIFNKIVAQSVLIHSIAGDITAKEYGVRAMTSNNLIHCLRKSFLELESKIIGEL